jgi:predicted O-methyltransferase YrrM
MFFFFCLANFQVGCYVGFSALRFGAAVLPRGQVHSVEMDPTVARLAQQVVQHAGLQQVVTVHVGHSEETPRGMG